MSANIARGEAAVARMAVRRGAVQVERVRNLDPPWYSLTTAAERAEIERQRIEFQAIYRRAMQEPRPHSTHGPALIVKEFI